MEKVAVYLSTSLPLYLKAVLVLTDIRSPGGPTSPGGQHARQCGVISHNLVTP